MDINRTQDMGFVAAEIVKNLTNKPAEAVSALIMGAVATALITRRPESSDEELRQNLHNIVNHLFDAIDPEALNKTRRQLYPEDWGAADAKAH